MVQVRNRTYCGGVDGAAEAIFCCNTIIWIALEEGSTKRITCTESVIRHTSR